MFLVRIGTYLVLSDQRLTVFGPPYGGTECVFLPQLPSVGVSQPAVTPDEITSSLFFAMAILAEPSSPFLGQVIINFIKPMSCACSHYNSQQGVCQISLLFIFIPRN